MIKIYICNLKLYDNYTLLDFLQTSSMIKCVFTTIKDIFFHGKF